MKYLILLIIPLLAACGGGGGSSEKAAPNPPTNLQIEVIGDSLCQEWPKMAGYDQKCTPGMALTKHFDIDRVNLAADRHILALGTNDGLLSVDVRDFLLAYEVLLRQLNRPICLLPPLTDTEAQNYIMEYRRGIKDICREVYYYPPSDASDGIHHTKATQRLIADIFIQRL